MESRNRPIPRGFKCQISLIHLANLHRTSWFIRSTSISNELPQNDVAFQWNREKKQTLPVLFYTRLAQVGVRFKTDAQRLTDGWKMFGLPSHSKYSLFHTTAVFFTIWSVSSMHFVAFINNHALGFLLEIKAKQVEWETPGFGFVISKSFHFSSRRFLQFINENPHRHLKKICFFLLHLYFKCSN